MAFDIYESFEIFPKKVASIKGIDGGLLKDIKVIMNSNKQQDIEAKENMRKHLSSIAMSLEGEYVEARILENRRIDKETCKSVKNKSQDY